MCVILKRDVNVVAEVTMASRDLMLKEVSEIITLAYWLETQALSLDEGGCRVYFARLQTALSGLVHRLMDESAPVPIVPCHIRVLRHVYRLAQVNHEQFTPELVRAMQTATHSAEAIGCNAEKTSLTRFARFLYKHAVEFHGLTCEVL